MASTSAIQAIIEERRLRDIHQNDVENLELLAETVEEEGAPSAGGDPVDALPSGAVAGTMYRGRAVPMEKRERGPRRGRPQLWRSR